MTDYAQEQEMEIEALQAILMDDIQEIDSSESGLSRINRCFQIMLSPQDDDVDESNYTPVKLALIFSHTEKYPDEPPLLNLKSVRGIKPEDLSVLKEKLQKEVAQNLGMAMVYTLVTSAKDWLSENFGREVVVEESEETDTTKDDIIVPHGEPVTIDTFLAWRERFEAELALERAKKVWLQLLKSLRRRRRTSTLMMTLKMMKKICWSIIWQRGLINYQRDPESKQDHKHAMSEFGPEMLRFPHMNQLFRF
ncbi:uncharacterized protein [Elaeis guineensis]|uniref:RWD domain-containing protein 1-like isoform X3 n=1 Tax=Elaeis guineensis var. tenera TaxID=51953 RepID=A0A8N4EY08_ELAGV|nr:RWD domain-containing protein 1-like isoform X3 [Elaeis guineensis]